jgi:starch synthase
MVTMPENLNVLFLAAEAEPFVKVGGLGDVAGSLPRFLRSLPPQITDGATLDVRLVLPLHPVLRSAISGLRSVLMFSLPHAGAGLEVQVFATNYDGLPVYFIDGSPISASGSVYSSDPALDADKYTFFSLAALELGRHLDWKPDIVHANDWHSALACYALLLRRWEGEFAGVSSILTVHNLPFMGPDVSTGLQSYGIAQAQTGLPEWASSRPLPLGLWSADAIVAVSPSYAREILGAEYGAGLEDYLGARRDSLNGILNGIDYDSFNPALDPAIASNFGIPTLERRGLNKAALQVRLGLPTEAETPILAVVSRLESQKGVDLVPQAIRKMGSSKWQLVVLGTGHPKFEQAMERCRQEFPNQVRVEFKYDGGLARQIYAGADMLVMPSRYEPCGLSQLIAMRYGCVPLVNAVGGLKDTVLDGETGFMIAKPTAARLATGLRNALTVYPDRGRWRAMQEAGMSQDFSWTVSARQYFQLYRRVLTQLAPH